MTKLIWDDSGDHLYETGVNQGVLYVQDASGYKPGVAWNGLTGVTESPSGAEFTALYADNIKYLNLQSAEEFGGTIEAYTYPDAFAACDGSSSLATGVQIGQQTRSGFGLSYKTQVGNDLVGNDYGYKLHLIYGAKASPSEKAYATVNDNPEAITFSWEFNTTPVNVTGAKPTSSLIVDSTVVNDAVKMARLEAILYGVTAEEFDASKTYAVGDVVTHTETDTEKTYICKTAVTTPAAWSASNWEEFTDTPGPRLPLPDEVIGIFKTNIAG